MTKTAFIKVGQYRVRYLEVGISQKPIVLLHGLGASAERWLPLAPYLSSNYRVIIPDIIGFGYSDKPVTNYSPNFFTKFLFDFMNSLSIERPILVGSSLGGRILIEYALRHPQNIEKMVLVSPAINDEPSTALQYYMQAALHPTVEDVKKAFLAMGDDMVSDEFVSEFINRMEMPNAKMAFLASLIGLKKDVPTQEKLTLLENPTLLIWGENDQVIPIENADKFNKSSTNLQYCIMEKCGHTPYVEKPKLFSRILLDFLSS